MGIEEHVLRSHRAQKQGLNLHLFDSEVCDPFLSVGLGINNVWGWCRVGPFEEAHWGELDGELRGAGGEGQVQGPCLGAASHINTDTALTSGCFCSCLRKFICFFLLLVFSYFSYVSLTLALLWERAGM